MKDDKKGKNKKMKRGTKLIMITLIVLIAISMAILIGYVVYRNYGDIAYIGTIESIFEHIITVNCYEGKNVVSMNPGLYDFSAKNIKILDSKNKRIEISELKVGDTIEITMDREGMITPTYPVAGLGKVKRVKIISTKEL